MTRRAVGGVALVLAIGLLAGVPAAPAAAVPTTISFVTTSPAQAAYGDNWHAQLVTRLVSEGAIAVPSTQATVDIMASGVSEPIATGLPIQQDGSVYVSASATAPLPPGTYELTALLIPAPGSYVETSQTSSPLVLQISAFGIVASIEVFEATADAPPIVELGLSGEYVETTAEVPAGTWELIVRDGDEPVLETEIAQPAGSADPIEYAIETELALGREFVVEAEFIPVASLAAGLEVTQPESRTLRTRDGGVVDTLMSRVPYPLWLLLVTILVPLGLGVAALILTIRRVRGRTRSTPDDVDAGTAPWSLAE
jgi:hypothetical protein